MLPRILVRLACQQAFAFADDQKAFFRMPDICQRHLKQFLLRIAQHGAQLGIHLQEIALARKLGIAQRCLFKRRAVQRLLALQAVFQHDPLGNRAAHQPVENRRCHQHKKPALDCLQEREPGSLLPHQPGQQGIRKNNPESREHQIDQADTQRGRY